MKIRWILFLLFTTIFFRTIINAQNKEGVVIEAIDIENISVIINSIHDSIEVVGLGESSHYTMEYYEYRTKIITELIQRDFKLLLFEVDYGTAIEWNRFIKNGVGDIDDILRNCPWWTYSTLEFKNLLEYLRVYNTELADEEKVSVFGLEMTYLEGLFQSLTEIVKSYYQEADKEKVIEKLAENRNYLAFSKYESKEIEDYLGVRDVVRKIKKAIENNSNIPTTVNEEIVMIENIISQFLSYISLDNQTLKARLRDQFSFNNYEYLRYFNDNNKTIVWAHTGHLEKTYSYVQLGHLLNFSLGNNYYNLTFDYGSGENGTRQPELGLSAVKFERKKGSLTDYLYNLEPSDYFIDVVKSRKTLNEKNQYTIMNTLNEYTDTKKYYPYRKIDLLKAVDGLIFIRETHMPTSVK